MKKRKKVIKRIKKRKIAAKTKRKRTTKSKSKIKSLSVNELTLFPCRECGCKYHNANFCEIRHGPQCQNCLSFGHVATDCPKKQKSLN